MTCKVLEIVLDEGIFDCRDDIVVDKFLRVVVKAALLL